MAGEAVRDAFRAELAAVLAAASPPIAWPVLDGVNAGGDMDTLSGCLVLEFNGNVEAQLTASAPGANTFRETGTALIHVLCPVAFGRGVRDLAERYAQQVRVAFRDRRFGGLRITSAGPAASGPLAGGMWAETIALDYVTYSLG